jgi:threonine/homoserine/homoserine lactone efflux protein
LTWRIATSSRIDSARGTAKPIGFWQAVAFQWSNGKAWVAVMSAMTTYTVVDSSLPLQIGAIAVLALVITLASVSSWTLFGHFLRDYLHTELRRRWFNYAMAGLLLLSIVPVFFDL